MKKLLILFFFLCLGSAAFANTTEKQLSPPNTDPPTTETVAKKNAQKAKAQETVQITVREEEKEQPAKKACQKKECNSVDGSKFGISAYIVDFVHNSNIKLVKMLL